MIMNRSDSLGFLLNLLLYFLLNLLLSLLLNGKEGAFGVESSLESSGLLVVGGDLGNLGEVLADALEEGPGLVLSGVDSLDVVGVLSDDEVGKSEVSDGEVLLPDEFVELVKLDSVLLEDGALGSLVVLVEEQSLDGRAHFGEDGEDAFDLGVVLGSLSEEFSLSPSVDDVSLDGGGFSHVVLSVNQVGEVGEVQAEVELVLSEPLVSVGVVVVFELHSRIGEQQSGGMGQTSDAPVGQLDLGKGGLESSEGRNEGEDDGVGARVVSLDSGKSLDIMSDSPPERVGVLLAGVESFEVVEVLSQSEVNQGEIAESELLIADEMLDEIKLGTGLLKLLDLDIFVVLVPEESADVLESVVEDTEEVVDLALVLDGLAQQFSLAGLLDDVLGDGGGLGEFEVPVDEVGEVGEVEANSSLVLLEPLVVVVVLHFLELHSRVGEQQTDVLCQTSDFPIAKDHFAHKICL